MKRRAVVLVCALAGVLGALPSQAALSMTMTAASVSSTDVRQTTASSHVPGVIVRVRDGVPVEALEQQYGTSVQQSIPEIQTYLLTVPRGYSETTFSRWLQSDQRLVFAEPNAQLQAAESRQSSIAFSEGFRDWSEVVDQWAFPLLGTQEAQTIATGSGVIVAVLDTGVDLTHPALEAHLMLPGIEPGVVTDPGDDRAELVDTNGDGIVDGALGHGTHVAGIVVGMAPGALVLPVRVLDSDGVGYAFDVARGLVAAVEQGASVANLSLGMPADSLALDAAIDHARQAGAVVVGPAGNSGTSNVDYPAAVPYVLAVAGTDANDAKACFSSFGDSVDVSAPAVGILSTYVGGQYATWSGTSMAAPFASGIVALVYERLGARGPISAARAIDLVRRGAQPLSQSDPVFYEGLGSGRVSAAASLEALALVSAPPATEKMSTASATPSFSGVTP